MYDPEFIPGCDLPLPELSSRLRPDTFNDAQPVEHTYFSLIFNASRGFAIVSAHNIDGATLLPEGAITRSDSFRFDPKVPAELQVDNDRGYLNNPWDRGHLARRRSLHWGERETAELADRQSFFWTNIVPQHNRLHATAWAEIENWMLELADGGDQRAAVFTGPVLMPDDPEIVNVPGEEPIRVPAGFWKIVAVKHHGALRAATFLVWQRDFDHARPVRFDPITEQVRLTTVEVLTGLAFPALREADVLRFGVTFAEPVAREQIRAGSARTVPAAVTCKADIVM